MRHQWRDEYWQYGSVCENYDAIKCPVLSDRRLGYGYTNAVSRLIANLSVSRKGLIGPWAHSFPHDARPGPEIGYLQEAVRWWDHWLKGIDTGIMNEPIMRAWMQESVPPQPQYDTRPGRWIAEKSWPSPRIEPLHLHLNWGILSPEADETGEASVSSPQTLGVRAGELCGFGADGEAARDQRPDDGGSLVFDAEALKRPLELFGAPVLKLRIKSNRPVAFLVARLCDVSADGASSRISYGILNLCHRDSHIAPASAGARALVRCPAAARRSRLFAADRTPAAARSFDRLLADDLALARARHAHCRNRQQCAGAAGAAAAR